MAVGDLTPDVTAHYAAMTDRLLIVEDGAVVQQYRDQSIHCLAVVDGTVLVGTVDAGVCRFTGGTPERCWPADAPQRVTSLAASPHDPAVVWAGTEPSELYRSADGGRTWTQRPGLTDLPSASEWSFPPRPHTHHVRWIEPDPNVEGRLYIGIEAGTLVIADDSGGWTDRPSGSRRDNHQLATHPDAPGRVYAAAGDGYAESTDSGQSWHYPQSGLDHRYVWSVAVAPDDPDDVFLSAATGPRTAHDPDGEAYVYRRRDDGWEHAMDGLPGPKSWGRPVLASGRETVHALTTDGLFTRRWGRWERVDSEWPSELREQLPQSLVVR